MSNSTSNSNAAEFLVAIARREQRAAILLVDADRRAEMADSQSKQADADENFLRLFQGGETMLRNERQRQRLGRTYRRMREAKARAEA